MTRILLLSLVFAPDGVSTSVLMSELASELKELGNEVTVLTTTPHYNIEPEARARQPLRNRWGSILQESNYESIPVFHVSIPEKGTRVGSRLLDYARFHLLSTLAGIKTIGDYDIIFCISPPLSIGLSAWLLGLIKRVPFVYNVQEIYPDIAVSLGLLKNPWAIRFFEWLERLVYGRAASIPVISEGFRRRLIEKGVPESKLPVIPNFVDTDFLRPGPQRNSFSEQYGLTQCYVVLYAGNIGLTQGFETIISAARSLKDLPEVRFVIVGNGARRPWLEDQMRKTNLTNVTLLPYQPESMIPQIYASSAVCLVPLKRGTAQGTFPSKIYSIMAAARPVIASADPDSDLAWIVEESGCGWVVPADDPVSLAATVRVAYAGRADQERLGRLGRTYVLAAHSRRSVGEQYDKLLRDVAGRQ